MAIYHNNTGICSGSKGGSAVASIAYQSADKVYCEQEGVYKDYTRKENVLDNGIVKPVNAPDWTLDRERLWNEVEKKEGLKGQYARKHHIALPKELDLDQQKKLVLEYCNYLSEQGMVCDWAIHNNKDGTNPHCHIMTTMRSFDEKGNWRAKEKNVTVRDKDGKAICIGRDKNGRKRYKHTTVKLTDWDKKETLVKWREQWADLSNKALEQAGSNERISAKSYKAQGKSDIPTQHLGYQANELEKKGIQTERGDWNREVKKFNAELNQLISKSEQLEKAIKKAEVIYYEQSRKQLKSNVRQTFNKSRKWGQRSSSLVMSDSRGLHLQEMQELFLGLGQNIEWEHLHDSANMYGDWSTNAEVRGKGNKGSVRESTTRKSNGIQRLQFVPAHSRGYCRRAVTICTLADMTTEEHKEIASKFIPLLKQALKQDSNDYKKAWHDIMENTVFARSQKGNLFLLNINKNKAIEKGLLNSDGKPKQIMAMQIAKGAKETGGELLSAGKDCIGVFTSAFDDKSREDNLKDVYKNMKKALKTPVNVVGDILTNPITAILKLPARALQAIAAVAQAGMSFAKATVSESKETKVRSRTY